jgi:hypothetical protein
MKLMGCGPVYVYDLGCSCMRRSLSKQAEAAIATTCSCCIANVDHHMPQATQRRYEVVPPSGAGYEVVIGGPR